MKAKFTLFEKNHEWVKGEIDKYIFDARLFDEPSKWGIDKGRVSLLSMYDKEILKDSGNRWNACVLNYDRGWDIRPTEEVVEYYEAVMELLENAPMRLS